MLSTCCPHAVHICPHAKKTKQSSVLRTQLHYKPNRFIPHFVHIPPHVDT